MPVTPTGVARPVDAETGLHTGPLLGRVLTCVVPSTLVAVAEHG
jgi:hypothetical protein